MEIFIVVLLVFIFLTLTRINSGVRAVNENVVNLNDNVLDIYEKTQDHWTEMEKLVPEETPDISYHDYGGEEYCGQCGAIITDEMEHCGQCGKEVGAEEEVDKGEESLISSQAFWLILALVVIGVVLLGAYVNGSFYGY